MRLLKLTLTNINALVGTYGIDFTHPDYANEGIFAIVGPTGSGKTTILDALCLALYDRTPRLDRINKKINELMSKGASHCGAKVEFEAGGCRYTASWYQHKANKKSDGNLQERKHILYKDGEPVIDSVKETKNKVAEVTGMDFNRFVQTVLLAQGAFDTFLKARAERKAEILESITGTEFYGNLSQKVHEKHKSIKDALKTILERGKEIHFDPEVGAPDYARELSLKEEEMRKIACEREALKRELEIAKTFELYRQKKLEMDHCQKEKDAFAEDEMLFAQKAKVLRPEEMRIEALEEKIHECLEDIRKKEESKSKREQNAFSLKEASDKAHHDDEKLKLEVELHNKTIETVVLLDNNINALNHDLLNLHRKREEIENNRRRISRESEKLSEDLESHKSEFKRITEALKDCDPTCEAGAEQSKNAYTQKKEYESALKKIKAGIKQSEKLKADLRETISDLEEKFGEVEKEETEKRAEINIRNEALDALRRQISDEDLDKKSEERLREQKKAEIAASLEEHRAKLTDGEACPLCGSAEHPYASGNIPKVSDIELICNLLKEQTEARRELKNKIDKTNIVLKEIGHRKERMTIELKNAREKDEAEDVKIAEAREVREDLELKSKQCAEDLGAIRSKYGIEDSVSDAAIEKKLRERAECYAQSKESSEALKDVLQTLENKQVRLKSEYDMYSQQIREISEDANEKSKNIEEKKDERRELFGDRNTETEKKRLKNLIEASEKEVRKRQKDFDENQREVEKLSAAVNETRRHLNSYREDLGRSKEKFTLMLHESAFADIEDYRKSIMDDASLKKLENEFQRINGKLNGVKALVKEYGDKVKNFDETERSFEEIERESKDKDVAFSTLASEIGAIDEKKSQYEKSREQYERWFSEKEAVLKELRRWEKLDELIGSADGSKYRKHAQALTLEILLNHANVQLSKMSDRYWLMPGVSLEEDEDDTRKRKSKKEDSKQDIMDIFVCDTYNNGEVRSIKNLSGGESFMVSLALALGLSEMVNTSNAKIDSLFLDEGFGTLDDECLDMTLAMLSSHQREGKIIGIISHVQALKDRIPTKLEVVRTGNGKSTISGPGVTYGADKKD